MFQQWAFLALGVGWPDQAIALHVFGFNMAKSGPFGDPTYYLGTQNSVAQEVSGNHNRNIYRSLFMCQAVNIFKITNFIYSSCKLNIN